MSDSLEPINPKTALLLIAHGSREVAANQDLHHLAAQLRKHGRYGIVEASFLELAEPNIEQGGDRCMELGATTVILVPYFLSAGVHVRRDLTEARSLLSQRYREVTFRLAEPLGPHPLLVELVLERARQAE